MTSFLLERTLFSLFFPAVNKVKISLLIKMHFIYLAVLNWVTVCNLEIRQEQYVTWKTSDKEEEVEATFLVIEKL